MNSAWGWEGQGCARTLSKWGDYAEAWLHIQLCTLCLAPSFICWKSRAEVPGAYLNWLDWVGPKYLYDFSDLWSLYRRCIEIKNIGAGHRLKFWPCCFQALRLGSAQQPPGLCFLSCEIGIGFHFSLNLSMRSWCLLTSHYSAAERQNVIQAGTQSQTGPVWAALGSASSFCFLRWVSVSSFVKQRC